MKAMKEWALAAAILDSDRFLRHNLRLLISYVLILWLTCII